MVKICRILNGDFGDIIEVIQSHDNKTTNAIE